MSLEVYLAQLDERIEAARTELDTVYEVHLPESERDRAWDRLGRLMDERDYLRSRFAGTDIPHDLAWRMFRAKAYKVLEEFGRAWREFVDEVVEKLGPVFDQLAEAAGLYMHTLKKLVNVAGPPKKIGPAQVFGCSTSGTGPLTRAQFHHTQPPNRKPVLPGYMIQKGRG